MENSDRKSLLSEASAKIAHYLSRRSHSEKELRDKLKSHFASDLIEEAVETAKDKKWLEDPYELAVQVKSRLDEKNKSWRFISSYLKQKGLPLPDYDREIEKAKIKKLLEKKKQKVSKQDPESFQENLKIKRFLSYRLFDPELISQVLEEITENMDN